MSERVLSLPRGDGVPMGWIAAVNPYRELADPTGHIAAFHTSDGELAASVAAYLAPALLHGDTAVTIALEEHAGAIAESLAAAGVDVDDCTARGVLVAFDAEDLLAELMGPDGPERARFESRVGGILDAVAARSSTVRVFGEMVGVLWAQGRVADAAALEDMWNDIAASRAFGLLCGYASVDGPTDGICEADVARRHHAVIRTGGGDRPVVQRWQRFEPRLDAPGAARRFVAQLVEHWGHHGLSDHVAIVVTELATNAVMHARSPFHIAVSRLDGQVRVEVHDLGPDAPVEQAFSSTAEGGRGLALVAALSTRWGIDRAGSHKIVWAELA